MAETIKIEIPVEVLDKTDALKGIKDKLIGLDSAAKKSKESIMTAGISAGKVWSSTVGVVNKAISPLSSIASAIVNPLTGLAATAGLGMGLNDVISTFSGFQSTMSEVKALSGATGAEFQSLTEKAKEMGAATKFTAEESAAAFKYMGMAGWNPEQMEAGIEGILNLAAASGEDLAQTSDIVTDALTAFGMDAEDSVHFSDVLAQASAKSNTDVALMGETFKYAGTMAGALKYSIEDVALATGLMANSGIKGTMAGTALNSLFTRLATNTSGARDAIEELGVSFYDESGNARQLSSVLGELRTATSGMNNEQKSSLANTIAGLEAQKGLLAILNASEKDYQDLENAIHNADGAAKAMSETMLDNLAGSMTLLSSAADGVKISLGERFEPYLRGGVDWLTDIMPSVDESVNEIMDEIDIKAGQLKDRVDTMINSNEWQESDLFGKFNIGFDELIVDPFMDWTNSSGKHLVSKGIGNLFAEASKILPGGKKAGIASWLSTAAIIKGADPLVRGVQSIASSVGAISPVARTAVTGMTALAAGIGAVSVAMDNYNEKMIDSSLEEHFGKVELSAKQAKEFADQLIDVKFKTNIETALGDFKNLDNLKDQAEMALAENDSLEWKCSVGLKLTEDETQSYEDNISTFIEARKESIQTAARAASQSISEIINSEQAPAMLETIGSWLTADMGEADRLSSELTTAVQNALTDGIIDVDEQAAISALQGKINSIMSSWSATEADTQIDLIKQKYGRLTGKDLTSGAFTDIVESFQESRESTEASLSVLSEDFFNLVNGAKNSGRLDKTGSEQWKRSWNEGVLNKQGSSLASALTFEGDTLQDTYGSEIEKGLSGRTQMAIDNINSLMNPLFESGAEMDFAAFQQYLGSGISSQRGNAGGALSRLYETMAPDVQAMGEIIDQYREEFGYVPKNIKDAYNSAIDIGAAAGDESAALQKYANALLEHGGEQMVNALTDPSNSLYSDIREASPQLAEAIDRALTETGKSVEIEGVMAEFEEMNVDDSKAKASVERALEEFKSSISSSGSQLEVTAEGVQVTIGSAEVDGRSAIEQIAAAVNMSADELAIANGYNSAVEVPIGANITIPPEAITFDPSLLQSAAQEAAGEVEAPPAEVEQDVNVTAGDTNVEQARAEAEGEAQSQFETPLQSDADVSLAMTHSNSASEIERIYGEVDGEVKGKFAGGFTASADVAVTLNWHITNPSASINTNSAGSTVTASIGAAHAEGGMFDSPHYGLVAEDGPEAIIPLGAKRRERGLDLWMKAGQALGVRPYANGGIIGKGPVYTEDNASRESSAGNKVEVIVNLSPSFSINEGGDENSVIRAIAAHLKDMIGDVAMELADKIAEAEPNTPVVV